MNVTIPNKRESQLAKSALLAFRGELEAAEKTTQLRVGSKTIEIPRQAIEMFSEILDKMANGEAVMLIPLHKELTTTQEAADILGVSRPYGEIPHRKLRRHRTILFEDLMEYKERSDREMKSALDALTAEAQELGMGYD